MNIPYKMVKLQKIDFGTFLTENGLSIRINEKCVECGLRYVASYTGLSMNCDTELFQFQQKCENIKSHPHETVEESIMELMNMTNFHYCVELGLPLFAILL